MKSIPVHNVSYVCRLAEVWHVAALTHIMASPDTFLRRLCGPNLEIPSILTKALRP